MCVLQLWTDRKEPLDAHVVLPKIGTLKNSKIGLWFIRLIVRSHVVTWSSTTRHRVDSRDARLLVNISSLKNENRPATTGAGVETVD